MTFSIPNFQDDLPIKLMYMEIQYIPAQGNTINGLFPRNSTPDIYQGTVAIRSGPDLGVTNTDLFTWAYVPNPTDESFQIKPPEGMTISRGRRGNLVDPGTELSRSGDDYDDRRPRLPRESQTNESAGAVKGPPAMTKNVRQNRSKARQASESLSARSPLLAQHCQRRT